jgi:hypothetical protein
MEAVAAAGITFDAWSPTRELAIPRMFNEGSVISSVSVLGPPSVAPSQSSRINCRSIFGAAAIERRSRSVSGSMSS